MTRHRHLMPALFLALSANPSIITARALLQHYTLGKKAIMQGGSIEHEQIIYESSNRRMKQLMDWLSNSH